MKYILFMAFIFSDCFAFGQRNVQLRQFSENSIATETRDQANDPASSFNYIYSRESNILWTKEVLRSIDLSATPNSKLLHIKTAKDSDQTIIFILLQELINNNIQAFAGAHDNAPLNQHDAIELLTKADTEAIKEIHLLEGWRYDPSIQKMVVKIIGIAPCGFEKTDTSHCKEIFWVKYVQLQRIFKQDIMDITIADFFEARMFTSKILNVSTVDTVYYDKK